jgi:acyl-CoA hydrolase/GNAT superfamily N-acetyltransferase
MNNDKGPIVMNIDSLRQRYPHKLAPENEAFGNIHGGDRIFVGTACGEPQYLVQAFISYVESNPKAFFDAELLHILTLGVAPYADERFRRNFRHNSFFVGESTRNAVNKGLADYTPAFLSQVPGLLRSKLMPIDVALIQVSPPDDDGYVSLGVSVDIVKAAAECAPLVIAQMNGNMPRTCGASLLHIDDIDFVVPYDEPLLEYEVTAPSEIAARIGKHVARIVEDGDTIQVGYGSMPNAILANLAGRKDLGVHTELFTAGIAELMKKGVITNSRKNVDRGKTVAAFCMGNKETYDFIDNNDSIEFRGIDYTNNIGVIARTERMTAINGALEIDLTGQATAESLGKTFYSGIGGQADFMRGAALSSRGKTIVVLQSTARNGRTSRIVPFLKQGAGVTLTRGDVHYVVTEHGIAYLHGKSIRERAMALIGVAHPKFQPQLVEAARKLSFIYKDQRYMPGKAGEYPEGYEAHRVTRTGQRVFMRPVRISDEALLKDFFYSLSDETSYKRFMSVRRHMPHERLQDSFLVIDYTREMVILSILDDRGRETVTGVAQFRGDEGSHTAEVAVVVTDEYQNKGIGTELLIHLAYIARRQGLLAFFAEVLKENRIMLHVFEKTGFRIEKESTADTYNLRLGFREVPAGDEEC